MNDVVLFQPKIGSMDSIRSKPAIPLSLLSIASFLKNRGYHVKIIDQRINPKWEKSLNKEFKKSVIAFGTTCLTGEPILHSLIASKIAKENSIPVIWGGVHPSLLPHQTLENENIDVIVKGEGEETFFELIQALERNRPLNKVSGIFFKNNSSIKKTKERSFINLDTLPPIDYKIIDINEYLPKYKGKSSLYMESSRGCTFNCAYCYNTVFNKKCWRSKS
jgi:radical SAM superfamily enzyme YgiQ (UPF0313 family)